MSFQNNIRFGLSRERRNIKASLDKKTCKLSERRNHLDYVALEAMELFFDSKQITDYDYIRSHKEKAVRHLSFFHTLMNRYMSHKEYYLKEAPPAIRVFMFLIMGGTQYAEICAPKINYALYGYGYGNGALGGSSAQTVYPGYEPGVDYNKMKAANEKVSRLKSARALTDYYVEFSDCKIMQIDPYSEKGLKKKAVRSYTVTFPTQRSWMYPWEG